MNISYNRPQKAFFSSELDKWQKPELIHPPQETPHIVIGEAVEVVDTPSADPIEDSPSVPSPRS